MSAVLTTAALVTCGHPTGVAQVTSTSALRVRGNAVLTEANLKAATFAGCLLASAGVSGNVSCTKVLAVTQGPSGTLRVNGTPVMLDTLAGNTNGTSSGVTPQVLLKGSDATSLLTAAIGVSG